MPKQKITGKTAAADSKYEISGHCNTPDMPERAIAPDVHPERARLIRSVDRKWVNNTELQYCFLDEPAQWRGSDANKDVVRAAFTEWQDLPIGLNFSETNNPNEAEIRVGFFQSNTAPGAGSWSYIGRDTIDLATDPAERTMNFGWDLGNTSGYDTALHEIGHALGFPHEHQNPNAGIQWDETAVYDYFTGPPNNWSRDATFRNVLKKLSSSAYKGSDWDPKSVMHYSLIAGMIERPEEYQDKEIVPGPGLSTVDIQQAKKFYPRVPNRDFPALRPYEAQRIRVAAGQQLDFVITPENSRTYSIQTFGAMDTVMVLFEEIDGRPQYLKGDDDSGWDRNARIEQRLFNGRKYFLRLRLYYAEKSGEGALMMY